MTMNPPYNTEPTDTQLKQALAKMLPEKVIFIHDAKVYEHDLMWRKDEGNEPIHDTELLYLCWLVEETLKHFTAVYILHLHDACGVGEWSHWPCMHATWQQRVIALCNVKGVEIL